MAEKSEKTKEERGLVTWDPFGDLELFGRGWPFRELTGRGRLGRLMEEMLGERVRARGEVAPALDIHETDGEYVVTVELPGVKKEDVIVELNEGVLTVRGEKKSEREEKKERSRWIERTFGSFSRSFTLPPSASPDRIEAAYKDGILTLRIAKVEETKPRTIAVK